ncbi:MAG: hypothetical protein ACSHXL_03045 [Bacteroidota bacterium]
MESKLQNHKELIIALHDASFLTKTKEQIVKDFAKVDLGFLSNFVLDEFNKEEIELLIANEVATLMEKGERHLLQLLYIIDISEKSFLSSTMKPDFLQIISEQILLREAYKVWLRGKFS